MTVDIRERAIEFVTSDEEFVRFLDEYIEKNFDFTYVGEYNDIRQLDMIFVHIQDKLAKFNEIQCLLFYRETESIIYELELFFLRRNERWVLEML